IGERAGVGVHVSHFNSRADLVLPMLDNARHRGVDVTYDLYCYLAGSSLLGMYGLPPWVQEGGIEATVARLKDRSVWPRLLEWFRSPKVPLESIRLSYVADPEWKHYEGMTPREAIGNPYGPEEVEMMPGLMGEFICNVLTASDMAVGVVVPHRRRGEE